MPKHSGHGSSTTSSSNAAGANELTAAAAAPRSSNPVVANFVSHHLTIGCGVAIFHVASEKVVLCFHSRDRYWFLPKGRKDAGESIERAAEREGFEESGYRNRLLPLPIPHRQPASAHAKAVAAQSASSAETSAAATVPPPLPFSTEPVWTQLIPQSVHTQYILFWYVAETVPPDVEALLHPNTSSASANATVGQSQLPASSTIEPYTPPPPYPPGLSLSERVAMEPPGYVPPRHEGTGVDAEEALYESYLVPVEEAVRRLKGTVMADVISKGWAGIKERREWEEKLR
ncbi:hypothetical protein IWZ01DRAFT_37411 [Phyllosticta capitalensis]